MTMAYTPNWTKCGKSGNGEFPKTIYYEYDTIEDEYPNSEFVKADELLDPDRDLAPIQWFREIQNNAIRRSQRLQERTPTARLESQMLNETFNNIPVEQETEDKDTIIYTAGSNRKLLLASIEKEFDLNQIIRKNLFLFIFIYFFLCQGGESAVQTLCHFKTE